MKMSNLTNGHLENWVRGSIIGTLAGIHPAVLAQKMAEAPLSELGTYFNELPSFPGPIHNFNDKFPLIIKYYKLY